jgi:hypothetical protein
VRFAPCPVSLRPTRPKFRTDAARCDSVEDMRPMNELRMQARWKLGRALREVERAPTGPIGGRVASSGLTQLLTELDLTKQTAHAAQRKFVAWWNANVGVRHGYARHDNADLRSLLSRDREMNADLRSLISRDRVNADLRSPISRDRAEDETGVAQC